MNTPRRGFASFVLVFVMGKTFAESLTLLVQEFKNYRKPGPPRKIWWKTPGGRWDDRDLPDETWVECAIRRLFGETGIRVTPAQLKEFRVVPHESHDKRFFSVVFPALPELVPYGDRHNIIGQHTPEGFASLVESEEVHPEHVAVLMAFLREMEQNFDKIKAEFAAAEQRVPEV